MSKFVWFIAAMAAVSALVCSARAAVITVEPGGDIAAAVAKAQTGGRVDIGCYHDSSVGLLLMVR